MLCVVLFTQSQENQLLIWVTVCTRIPLRVKGIRFNGPYTYFRRSYRKYSAFGTTSLANNYLGSLWSYCSFDPQYSCRRSRLWC